MYAIARIMGLFGGMLYLLHSIRGLREAAAGTIIAGEGDEAT